MLFNTIALEPVDSPEALNSLGLMQRMYEGSLDDKMSISLLRLFLNWLMAVSGRFLLDNSNVWNTFYNRNLPYQYRYLVIK